MDPSRDYYGRGENDERGNEQVAKHSEGVRYSHMRAAPMEESPMP